MLLDPGWMKFYSLVIMPAGVRDSMRRAERFCRVNKRLKNLKQNEAQSARAESTHKVKSSQVKSSGLFQKPQWGNPSDERTPMKEHLV